MQTDFYTLFTALLQYNQVIQVLFADILHFYSFFY